MTSLTQRAHFDSRWNFDRINVKMSTTVEISMLFRRPSKYSNVIQRFFEVEISTSIQRWINVKNVRWESSNNLCIRSSVTKDSRVRASVLEVARLREIASESARGTLFFKVRRYAEVFLMVRRIVFDGARLCSSVFEGVRVRASGVWSFAGTRKCFRRCTCTRQCFVF